MVSAKVTTIAIIIAISTKTPGMTASGAIRVAADRLQKFCQHTLTSPLAAMMAERGLNLSHTTIQRWVIHYVPEFERRGEIDAVVFQRFREEGLTAKSRPLGKQSVSGYRCSLRPVLR